jgi:DNA-binding PadR family transcriptional regulator
MPARSLPPALPINVFHILLALSEGELHGYAIVREVEHSTDGRLLINLATLYRLLRQLVADGWIVEMSSDPADVRRRTYKLTPRGRRIAQAEAERLLSVIRIARERRLLPATS